MRPIFVLVAAGLLGCGMQPPLAADGDAPDVQRVEPNCVADSNATRVAVLGRHLRSTYDAWKDEVSPLHIRIDAQETVVLDIDGEGTRAQVTLPDGLLPGLHDLTAKNTVGQDTLQSGLLVGSCP